MTLAVSSIFNGVQSHALSVGHFERVNGHEPKVAPGVGVTCALWVQDITPVKSSGLNSTSVRLEFTVRTYQSMLSEPRDAIDPKMLIAVSTLMAAYSADFTLGGLIRVVDLLGAYGDPMNARAGYLEQDKRLYRVMTITLPLIVNDVWDQVA
jgi:hypothetical protein